jgi:parallel beta-helix repeat protein
MSGWAMVLIVLSLAASAQARVWHVAEKTLPGIDPNDQVTTIGKGLARLEPGDSLLVHGGVYREAVTIDKSGTAQQPITIRAAEGESVTLTGVDRITDWTLIPGSDRVYSTPWPHKFVAWNKTYTHPNDDYHRLIGRCEQVFINGYPLHQVLERDKLSRGAFFADLEAQRLYIQPANNQEIAKNKALVEASTRDQILRLRGSYVVVKGLQFRYAANRAQQGAVQFSGDHVIVEDCTFEYTNASGATFAGKDLTVRSCTFQHNGQLGFGANRAHNLLMTGCTVRNNNTKGFDRGWEAGGDKICMTRGAILENSVFAENRGNGIWFDIGNEDCQVRNCLIANNENAGIFYEISYGLHAHDNVIVGNGFAFTPGAWGAAAGISLSSSPSCTIERNLILGNKEGFNFREQSRSTPRIDNRKSEPVWNHDQIVRHNVLAYNRDAQVWGWFDVSDERHWPKAVQAAQKPPQPAALSLEDLHLAFESNLYQPGPGQDLFNWGVTWKTCKRYENLDEVRKDLSIDRGSEVGEFHVEDYARLDLRVPADSPAVKMDCYPRGTVPDVRLGTLP